jgi:hypothetical protein
MNIGKLFFQPEAPVLTRTRIGLAIAVAAVTDAIQIALGPLGWLVIDEVLDVVAMVVISACLGFHPLLLPTFLLELFPVVEMIPTWTGCTAAVVLMRRATRSEKPAEPPVINVASEVTPVRDEKPSGQTQASNLGSAFRS